ncbi:Hypothetical protein BSPT2_I0168 [Brucella suis bv. 2]|nr:Hypothetical protein BSPT2_I0168 [Brucella suis bv. 2]
MRRKCRNCDICRGNRYGRRRAQAALPTSREVIRLAKRTVKG